jgi:hypothetical protein
MPDSPSDCPWEDLVVSILSVNQYSLERTYTSLPGLREQKITDPVSLAAWEFEEIEGRLRSAGCDRGPFMTKLFALRLSALGALIRTKGVAECEQVIGGNDPKDIEHLLRPVNGIGPVVLRRFFLLRGIPTG